ncbi:mechanosensitive ion channel family protein [Leptolyngbya sp. PCC 6406]|uniref:mechanosensitive ion channel family protein n=1 Tax=Leptolyngbya sp. PCC 6406 TaxID=1173264 RepID=UPI0002ACA71C|nr:mechanosensitive ion channel family protein [Leptolyngbya sp. PCC 6406]
MAITLLVSCLTALILMAVAAPRVALAQVEEALPPILNLETLAPPEVQALFMETDKTVAQAPVYLDGRVVFRVAAPAQTTATDPHLSAPERAREIERRLYRIAQDRRAPETIEVTRELDGESNQPIIFVNGQVLLTVTSLDAQLGGTGSLRFRALELSQAVERALVRYYLERQRSFLWEQTRWGIAALLGVILGSFAIARSRESLRHRQHRRRERRETPTLEPTMALRQTLISHREERIYQLQHLCLQLVQVALWLGLGFFLVGLYPYSRWLQPLIMTAMRLPLRFLLILAIAYGLIRLSEDWLERLFLAMQEQANQPQERWSSRSGLRPSQRLALRLSTFSGVIKGTVAVTIGLSALLVMLTQLGVQIGPLIAGAGILGIALSLASQNLIKDLINGFLILLEDQYGVGDVIIAAGVAGFVETMNLRITQLRNEEGRLITVPNGQIDVVQNLSKEWSRVDLLIPVGLTADLDVALALVNQVALDMSQDGVWGSLILEPPLLLGVEKLDHTGATLRLWIKTQPLKQWDVAREYRRRLKLAFEQAQIPIGVPQQRIFVVNDGNSISDSFPMMALGHPNGDQ